MPGRVCRCPIKCRSFNKGFALSRFRLIAVTENSGSYPYVASALRFIPAQADGCLFVPLAHSMTTPRDVRGFPSSVLSAMRTSPRPCHEARSHELRTVDLDAGSPGPLAPKQISRPRSIEFATRGKAASQQRRNGGIRGAWLSRHAVFETGEEASGSAIWKAQLGACGTRRIDTAVGTASILDCSWRCKFGLFISGVVAQMVERSLSMREVRGSIPRDSSQGCGNASSASFEASVV